MKRYYSIITIISLIFAQLIHSSTGTLDKKIFEMDEAEHLFRRANDIEIIGNNIYVIDNLHHTIFVYRQNGELTFQKKIGRPGQGPGDLNLPIEFSHFNGKIAVNDGTGFSFFDCDGTFISKFRTFPPGISFVYVDDKIYNVSINPNATHLIDVYSMSGKIVGKIGEKYLPIDYKLTPKMLPHRIERFLYQGKLLTDGKYLYYINKNFASLIKYSLKGEKVAEKDLTPFLGGLGKFIRSKNDKRLTQGIKTIEKDGIEGVPLYLFFLDIYLHKDRIYLFGHEIRTFEKIDPAYSIKNFEVLILELKSLSIVERYSIKLGEFDEIHSCAVKEENGRPVMVIAMSNEDGNLIAEYTIKTATQVKK